ncbi:hypothetical protein ACROYT_G030154 [Oculina patagonica]
MVDFELEPCDHDRCSKRSFHNVVSVYDQQHAPYISPLFVYSREMAKELKIFLVTCLLMFIVEAKPAPGNNGKGDHNDLAARGSGIEVDPSIPALINEMVGNPVHKYAAFKIVDKTRVVIDYDMLGDPAKTVTVEEDEKQFNKMKSLLTNEPRFILYDFRFTNKEGRLITKLVFIVWIAYRKDKIEQKSMIMSVIENKLSTTWSRQRRIMSCKKAR